VTRCRSPSGRQLDLASAMRDVIDRRLDPDMLEQSIVRVAVALEAWSNLPASVRADRLRAVRFSIADRQEELIHAVSSDTGKPVSDVVSQEAAATLGMLKFMERNYPHWLEGRTFRYLRPGFWTKTNTIRYDPVGMLAVIGPSNFPFSLVVMQAYASLMCGNGVVIKPSERCPLTAQFIRDVLTLERGSVIPAAVVTGGVSTARSLARHPEIAKVIFTGSSAAGAKIAALCGQHFKPCVLELGGNGTAIVCSKGIVQHAARCLVWSALYAHGRSCIGTRQVFVLAEAKNALLRAARTEYAKLRHGPIGDPYTDIAPDLELRIVESPPDLSLTPDALPAANVVMLRVTEVPAVEDAVAAVNASPFGLSASIWSEDIAGAERIAADLRVGMVWINDASVALPGFPWGGNRRSGWGRLFAREALGELTQLKTVSVDRRRGSRGKPWWFPHSHEKHGLVLALNRFLFGRNGYRHAPSVVAAIWRYLVRGRKPKRPFGHSR